MELREDETYRLEALVDSYPGLLVHPVGRDVLGCYEHCRHHHGRGRRQYSDLLMVGVYVTMSRTGAGETEVLKEYWLV